MNTYKSIEYGGVRAELSRFAQGGATETHVMLHVTDGMMTYEEQLKALNEAFEHVRREECSGSNAIFRRLFVSDMANQRALITEMLSDRQDCAVSIVEQPPLDGTKVALWVWFIEGATTRQLENDLYEVRHGAYRHLFGARQHRHATGSYEQTRRLLSDYADQLREEGLSLKTGCVRTWFFVQNVDVNYAGLVKARNEVFADNGLTTKTHFIASTGIGGRHNDHRVCVLMDTYAVDGLKEGQVGYLKASTHLNPTAEYGVAFERGAYIDYADRRHVLISGTASIDNKGNVVYPGNIRRQMARMVDNVQALLSEGGCVWSDVLHMIVYLRDISDRATVEAYFDTYFGDIPRVFTYARVCRPGWLIEMECMAVRQADNKQYAPL